MNYYETLYIIHPALEAGRLKDIIMSIENSLKKVGGDPLAIELWGKRKLAYFIDKQKYGTYVLVQFNGEGTCTRDFAVELEHNPNILAYLTTNIDQNDVIKQVENLETQIAGKTREIEKIKPRMDKDGNKESSSIDIEKQKSDSSETNEKESSDGEGEQISSEIEDIKDDESEEVSSKENEEQTAPEIENKKSDSDEGKNIDLPNEENDNEQNFVTTEPKITGKNKSTEENLPEEIVSESDQEKADEPSVINEKE